MTKKNKWWLILIYCICGVLIATAISLSVIKTNYAPDVNEPILINIRQVGSSKPFPHGQKESEDNKDVEVYNKIMTNYNDAFRESVMSGFFSGRTSFKSRIEECTGTNRNPIDKLTGYVVTFIFPEEQTLMLNGKIYNPPTNSNMVLKYTEMSFSVNEDEKLQSHDIYFKCIADNTAGYTYYRQTVMGSFADMYNTILDFE